MVRCKYWIQDEDWVLSDGRYACEKRTLKRKTGKFNFDTET